MTPPGSGRLDLFVAEARRAAHLERAVAVLREAYVAYQDKGKG
jgi:hypothetical protein